jgi:hypothetical protein
VASELQVVPARLEHAMQFAPMLRAGELDELVAQGFPSAEQALVDGICDSDEACTVFDGDKLVAMFGVAPDRTAQVTVVGGRRVGVVWFLTGEGFQRSVRRGLRVARRAVAAMLGLYPVLITVIDARYLGAVRWARWLGFTIGIAVPWGPLGMPFHPAVIRRPA